MTGEEKLQELMNNDELMDQLFYAETPTAFVDILAANGIALDGISSEEAYAAFHSAKNDEFDENALDNVAGGVLPFLSTLVVCASGPIGWAVGGIAIAAVGAYCYNRAKKR